MRIVKVGVLAPTNKGIPLGVQGESCATEVEFDVRPWFREYPSGTVSAVAKRDGDPAPYPLSLDVADGTAVWLVSDTDTAKAGEGAVELTMTSGGTRVRSLTFKTAVTASLTDAPVDDDAWYGWLDKAVVKVDQTVQAAQRKMTEVDTEWTGLKADVTAKVEECSEVAAQAAKDAHHAKVDAQATAKALESAEGSVAKAEAAAKRAVDAMLDADDSAVEASNSALSAGRSAEAAAKSAQEAKDAADKAVGDASAQLKGYVDAAAKSASDAATSEGNAATSSSAAAGSAEEATAQKVAAENAKDAAETFKAGAEAAKGEAATSASAAAASEAAAAKSAQEAASAASAINVIAPKSVDVAATSEADGSVAVGAGSVAKKPGEFSVGSDTLTREVTHVSEPTEDSGAATKRYVDVNTSNALVGTASGKLVHVEDAWPGKPIGLTIKGAYKQDGTTSPIEVVENPVLRITGRNLVNVPDMHVEAKKYGSFVPCGLVPKGTAAYVSMVSSGHALATSLDAAGTALKGARESEITYSLGPANIVVGKNKTSLTPTFDAISHLVIPGYRNPDTAFDMTNYQVEVGGYHEYKPYTSVSLPIILPTEHKYLAALPDGTHDEVVIDKYGNATLVAKVNRESASVLSVPTTYNLGKLDVPALPESISNLWVEASVTPELSMTYKRDINELEVHAVSMRSSSSITVADGTAKVNPSIFSDGLAVTDGQVSVNMDFVGEHLAGDALYYDQTDGLMLKVGQGLRIQNDELDLDQAGLPLASTGVRGTVRVGSGLAIDANGVLSATAGASGGYAALADVTAKTTERVGGIANGEDDVQTATVTAPVFEKDGALYAWGLAVARTVRTTYTTGTSVHVEMDFAVGQTRLNQSLLKLALVSFGDGFQYVPTTTHNAGDVVYLTVEVTVDKDVKAGSTMLVKFI